MTTEIAEKNSTDLEAQAAIAAEVKAMQEAEYEDENDFLNTPILKVGQALTQEVQEGEASPGEFINSLSGEGVGDTIDFIICYFNRGRFANDPKTGKTYVAFESTIPERWEDLVGPEWVGEPFSEYPEAEEKFAASVNDKEREWGHGPLVSTTFNYTGFVIAEGEEGDDYQPVRLSMKRTDKKAHRKIRTLQGMQLRNKSPWDKVIRLATAQETFGKNKSYVIDPQSIKFGRETTPEEKTISAQLALAVGQGRTKTVGAEDALEDKAAEPDAKGGLAV